MPTKWPIWWNAPASRLLADEHQEPTIRGPHGYLSFSLSPGLGGLRLSTTDVAFSLSEPRRTSSSQPRLPLAERESALFLGERDLGGFQKEALEGGWILSVGYLTNRLSKTENGVALGDLKRVGGWGGSWHEHNR